MGELLWRYDIDPPGYYFFEAGQWYDPETGEEVDFTDDDEERELEIIHAQSLGYPIDDEVAEALIAYADAHEISILDAIEEVREHGPMVRETHEWTDSDGERHKEKREVERRPSDLFSDEDKDERIASMARVMEQDAELEATVGFQSQAPHTQEGLTPSSMREEED